ncbi:MAG: UvrD-helicase domain-containing protein [Methanolinea sp.]|nr:MAG: UvrD-helicase domain-containing protein [Methanolinea sp.]
MLTEAQKKALAYDKSLCVTASAGTGKTHTLVHRYLHLMEDSGCKPSEILALTFTDKAAAEMKDRLLKEIYKKEGPFWNEIKDEMIWARVSTFHSFCRGLIKEFSMESGIDPSFAVLDDISLTKIMNEGIQKLFTRTEHDEIRHCTTRCLVAWGEHQTRMYLETLYRNLTSPLFSTSIKFKRLNPIRQKQFTSDLAPPGYHIS